MVTAVAHDQPMIGIAFVAGSVFPDLDVFFMVLGKRFYLRNHQGVTHSLILSPFYAMLFCLIFPRLPSEMSILWLWMAAWAGIGLHIMLDCFNTFGIALFAPLSRRRFSLDAVFFVDVVALLLTGSFYLFHMILNVAVVEIIYPIALAGYFLFKLLLHNRVRRRLMAMFVIPSSLNPFEFYVLEKNEGGFRGYLYNALTRRSRSGRHYPAADAKYQALAAGSVVFKEIKQITRAFQIIETEESPAGTRIVAADLAVRNFGGRFARTELRFDSQGRLTHEVANI